jgi:hypothetical protein
MANKFQDCLRDMILPVMQRVHDKVNFTLSFIGTPTKNDGVACKHGPEECRYLPSRHYRQMAADTNGSFDRHG